MAGAQPPFSLPGAFFGLGPQPQLAPAQQQSQLSPFPLMGHAPGGPAMALPGLGGGGPQPLGPFPHLSMFTPTTGPGAAFRPPAPGAMGQFQFFAGPPVTSMLTPSPSARKSTPGPQRSGSGGGKKQCNCKNSRCLKLYCECFASGRYCDGCNCMTCLNNRDNEATRQSAVEAILERNPNAFRPKIQGSGKVSDAEAAAARSAAADGAPPARHTKGCNCKKSTCLKKYCECFQAGIFCSSICKCIDCKNFDGSESRAQVVSVADAGFAAGFAGPQGPQGPLAMMATPVKRPRQSLTSGLGSVSGSGGTTARTSPGEAAGPSVGQAPPQSRAHGVLDAASPPQRAGASFQQVISDLVRPNIIEDLCQLLFMAADEGQERAAKESAESGGYFVGMGLDNGGAAGSAVHLQEAQERAILEEFSSILGKIVETASKRSVERLPPPATAAGGTPTRSPASAAAAAAAATALGVSPVARQSFMSSFFSPVPPASASGSLAGLPTSMASLPHPPLQSVVVRPALPPVTSGQQHLQPPAAAAGPGPSGQFHYQQLHSTFRAKPDASFSGAGILGGASNSTPPYAAVVSGGLAVGEGQGLGPGQGQGQGQGHHLGQGTYPHLSAAAAAAAAAMVQAMQAQGVGGLAGYRQAGGPGPLEQPLQTAQQAQQAQHQQHQQHQQQAMSQLHAAFALRPQVHQGQQPPQQFVQVMGSAQHMPHQPQ